jgi:trigger factor
LKIQTELREDHQVKVIAEIEQEILEDAKRRAGKSIAKRVRIPGFRPGKAPFKVVERTVGPGAILEEALDIVLQEHYPKIIDEANVNPYGPGSLEKVESLEPPIFEFTIPLAPEITLGDYRSIRIDYDVQSVTQEDVENVLESMQEQQAILEPVEHPAQEGDMVYVLLNGERTTPDENGETNLYKNRKLPIIIEKEDVDTETEWPFPGFSRHLIGLSAEDEKELDYTYPNDADVENLRGATIKFNVKVEEIKARILPELDDDFAKSVSEHETLEELKEEILQTLAERYESEADEEYENEILDEMAEDALVKYPPQMLEEEIDHAIEDLKRNLSFQRMDIETYLKTRDMGMEELRTELKEPTDIRLRNSLILMQASTDENISVEPEEIDSLTEQRIAEIRQYLSPEKADELLTPEAIENIVNRIISEEMSRKTLERLRAISKGEEVPDLDTEEKAEDKDEEEKIEKKKAKTKAVEETGQAEEVPTTEIEEKPVQAESEAIEGTEKESLESTEE